MSAAPEARRRRISKRTKFAFSVGSLEEGMVGAAGVATMIYYNQVLGVSPALCGTAFLIASIVDAVSDPLVGAFSDSVRTRWGRRHPFMFASAFPLALFFYLMYQPPAGWSEQGLFLWFTLTMVGMRVAKTFYSVPHSALGAELTDDYDERTSIFGWNWVVLTVGLVLLGAFVLWVIFPSTPHYANGLLDPDRYRLLAMFGGGFCFVAIMACTLMTADQIPFLHGEQSVMARAGSYYRRFFHDTFVNFRSLLVNPSYLSVCLCWLVLAVSGGVVSVAATYTFVYAFDFTTEQIALRDFVRLPGALLVVVVSAWLTRWLDKKYTVISTIFVTALLIGLPYTLRLLGWFPENGTIWLLVAFFGIWGLGFITLAVVPVVIDSQLVDVADEHELNTGNRAEGAIFAIRTFAIKMTQGLGGLIAGFGLQIIGFPQDAATQGVPQEAIDGLLFMMGPLYILIVYGGTAFAFMYRIDKRRHEEILRELEVRRQANAG